MEILNNIWLAISTPNEVLINILMIIATFIEAFLLVELFTSILNIKTTKSRKFTYVLILVISSTFSMYLIPTPLNIIFNYFIMSMAAVLIFKLSIIQGILSTILPSIFFALTGSLISNPYITMLNISSDDLAIVPIYRFFYLLIMYTVISIVCIIIKNKNIVINFLDDIDKRSKAIILANLIFGIITLCIQAIITFYYTDILPVIITFLSFISLLSYFAISIYSLTRILKLISTTKKLESEEEYNRTLRILHDNVRGFKHDFDNIVTTIGGFIRTNDMEGLKDYYVQLEDDCQRVNNLYILNPEVVNNDGIYNLLTKKYHEAESKDIKVNITFLLDLSTLNMKIYEFARILGILLDNAIEASSECEEKIINLTFRNDTKNSRQLIIVENTYNNPDIDTEKIFEKGVSEKENHTGLGLWEVRKLIKKNNNINLYTSKDNKFFTQQLEIYY